MSLNMNRKEPASVSFNANDWSPSPVAGVNRIRLERAEDESGWATSIVRYDPDVSFYEHSHPNGEEIHVLDGIFSDENGDYPAGTYIRNPDPSPHSPSSRGGCILLVRLCQMKPDQTGLVRVNSNKQAWQTSNVGLQYKHLYSDQHETIELIKVPAGTRIQLENADATVLEGEISVDDQIFPPYSWVRAPYERTFTACKEQDVVLLVKRGHLD